MNVETTRTFQEHDYVGQSARTVRSWEVIARRTGVPTIVWAQAPVCGSVITATPTLTWALRAHTPEELALVPVKPNIWTGIAPRHPRDYEPMLEALRRHAGRVKFLYVDTIAAAAVALDPVLEWIVMYENRAPTSAHPYDAGCFATKYYREQADELDRPFFLHAPKIRNMPPGWRQFPVGTVFPDAGVYQPPAVDIEPSSQWYPPEFEALFAEDE